MTVDIGLLIALTTALIIASLIARLMHRRVAQLEHDLAAEKNDGQEVGDALTVAQGQLGEALALVPATSTAVETWRRKYWEMNDLVASCLEQRDVWKDMWFTQSAEHLEGQAVLEQKVVQMRQNLIRGIVTCNRLLKERAEANGTGDKFTPIQRPADLDPLDAAPVGQASAYRDSMIALLKSAPKDFDALAQRDAITLGLITEGVFVHRALTTRAERLQQPRDVETPFGSVRAQPGDWIVRDIQGERVVVGHDVFKRSYALAAAPAEEVSDTGLEEGEEVVVQVLYGTEPEPA